MLGRGSALGILVLCQGLVAALSTVHGHNSVFQCGDLKNLQQKGTCRLGGCLDNEHRLPGERMCNMKSSLWAVFYCVDTLPCCSSGGSCRPECAPREFRVNATTDCSASGLQCCIHGEDRGARRREFVARRQGVCGRTITLSPRIIGGHVGQPHDWPWMARLINPASFDQGFCAGVLVDDDTVVTVAHCVSGIGRQDLKVLLGDFDMTKTEGGEFVAEVRSVEVNPNFLLGTRGNDFAVIKLARPVTFTSSIFPACIPDPDIPIVGGASINNNIPRGRGSDNVNHCFMAGWGRDENGNVSPRLRTAPAVPMDAAICTAVLSQVTGHYINQLPSDIICTDTAATNTDACLFDDGGMLVCLDIKNRYSLVGLVSEVSCGRLPTILTRVSNYTLPILARL